MEDDKAMRYVQDKRKLSKPCKPCVNVGEGIYLGNRLLEILKEEGDGVGLAANQVGVNAAVCVVNVVKPIVLINPRIVGKFGKSFFQEACLSFPGDYVLTERWTDIVVSAQNHRKDMIFSFEKNPLECVCVQHEIDHLNGITMFDRAVDMESFNGKE
jgi:peptide deformylase